MSKFIATFSLAEYCCSLKKRSINSSKHPEHKKALQNALIDYPISIHCEWVLMRQSFIVSSVTVSKLNGDRYYAVEYVLEEVDIPKYLAMSFNVLVKVIFSHIRWKRKYLARKAQYA